VPGVPGGASSPGLIGGTRVPADGADGCFGAPSDMSILQQTGTMTRLGNRRSQGGFRAPAAKKLGSGHGCGETKRATAEAIEGTHMAGNCRTRKARRSALTSNLKTADAAAKQLSIPAKQLSIPDLVLRKAEAGDASVGGLLDEALRLIRSHLGMQVAFVAEFAAGRRVFRHVDAAQANPLIKVGDSDPIEDSYCQRIVDGRLPELMRDAREEPAALELPVTTALPVGAHLGVPIRLNSGRIYGTLCCFSTTPDQTLGARDLGMLRVFADFAAREIDRELALNRMQDEIAGRIRSVLAQRDFTMLYQPIYLFQKNIVVGFESLARFAARPEQPPDVWFKEAALVGLGPELEAAAIALALQGLDRLPEEVYVSINVAPATILSGAIVGILERAPLERIVVEVTEHVSISEYSGFARVLKPLRERGLRLAVDDAGAGYASFRHIIELEPDLIKLDISLIRDIDSKRSRRALAAALIRFAEETGSKIISEGVETEAELDTLRQLGVNKVQGFLIGRPMTLSSAAALFEPQRFPG
jgi:EAL domain-containing protein (putative c-di-GMP-specific phosphodiesterase class I)